MAATLCADNQQEECVPVDHLDSVQLPCNDDAAPSEDIKEGFEPGSPRRQSFSSSSVKSLPKKGSPLKKNSKSKKSSKKKSRGRHPPVADVKDSEEGQACHKGGPTNEGDRSANHEPKTEVSDVGPGNTEPAVEPDAACMKRIDTIVLRQNHIKPLFFSPYPPELAGMCVYLCEFCLMPTKSQALLRQHLMGCLYKSPPGNEIYHKGCYSIFEVDGRKDKWYAQNLCLLAKCFLENKAVCCDISGDIDCNMDPSYDVDPYLFYVLTENDRRGRHIVGYFSKEKFPLEDHNMACILVLPPYQRRGFGRLLVEFSYELSKHEGKTGTPKMPLSQQGLLLYESYWRETILSALIKWWKTVAEKEQPELSINHISRITSIKKDDVIETMRELGLFVCCEGGYGIPIPDNVVAIHRKAVAKEHLRLDPKCIQWKPEEVARPCV